MEHDHSVEAIQERLSAGPQHNYLRDWIYGGIDGSVTTFAVVTGVLGACQVFALVAVLTGGGPLGSTDVVVYRIYRTAWEELQFGDASVLSLLLFALLLLASKAQLKLLDRRVEYA